MTQAVAAQAMHRSRALEAKASFSSPSASEPVANIGGPSAPKMRGSHFAAVPHTIIRVMNGLGEQVVERFKLSWSLQPWDFGAQA